MHYVTLPNIQNKGSFIKRLTDYLPYGVNIVKTKNHRGFLLNAYLVSVYWIFYLTQWSWQGSRILLDKSDDKDGKSYPVNEGDDSYSERAY